MLLLEKYNQIRFILKYFIYQSIFLKKFGGEMFIRIKPSTLWTFALFTVPPGVLMNQS